MRVVAAIGVALALLGCQAPDEAPETRHLRVRAVLPSLQDHWGPAPDAERGRTLAVRFECARCHDGTDLPAPAPAARCFACHDDIVAGRFDAPPDALADWAPHVATLRRAPSLAGVGSTLDPWWIQAYLQQPHDVRPGLVPTMPRLALTPDDARDLTGWLTSLPAAPTSAAPSAADAPEGDAARGRALYQARGCATCHAFTGAGVPAGPALPTGAERVTADAPAIELAPDLRHARDRMGRDTVEAWLLDPRSLRPDARMPDLGLTPAQAADLAAFVLETALDLPVRSAPAHLPLLTRPVTFDEVEARVFRRSCWHCHSQPALAHGDGGPGNTGGFGFGARGIDLSSYESIAGGHVARDGQRRSLFARTSGGLPLLVAALHARHEEEAGTQGEVRGMPLGLPPLPPEDIQLVASWVAQGRPR